LIAALARSARAQDAGRPRLTARINLFLLECSGETNSKTRAVQPSASSSSACRGGGVPLPPADAVPGGPAPEPVPPGTYLSAVIVLLADGQTTTGADPIEAAKMAADRGVRIYTVGIGTKEDEILRTEGWSMRVRLDEESPRTISFLTHGE